MTARPSGANSDEWRTFLCRYLDSRATSLDGLSFVAVQIVTAIESERGRCAIIADESARIGDEDGNPDVVAAARIIARKIRNG